MSDPCPCGDNCRTCEECGEPMCECYCDDSEDFGSYDDHSDHNHDDDFDDEY